MSTHLRQCIAEAVGTGFLVATVVGSGIAATRLSPGETGLQLLVNALATGAVLVALVLALGHVSASFNPVVSLVDALRRGAPGGPAAVLIACQVAGAVAGTVLANLMFDDAAVSISSTDRISPATFLAEVVATVGLCLVVFGTLRSTRPESVAVAVGAYITAAYWFTSSTSFANPAVTIGRALTDSFAGIAPTSVAPFVAAQLVGGALAYALVRALFPADLTESVDR